MPPRINHTWVSPAAVSALMIVLTGLALRLYGLGWGLPDVYEEATPLKTAWNMWNWDRPTGIDPNPHFFNYPSLMIYLHFGLQALLYGTMKLGGTIETAVDYQVKYMVDATPWYVAGRLVSTVFALGAVVFTYLVGRRIRGTATGLLAAAFLAANAYFVERSQMIEVDVPLTFATTFTLWAALRILDAPTRRNDIVAGVALGAATSIKYTGAMLMIPLVVAGVLAARKTGERFSVQHLGLACLVAALVFVVSSPYIVLDFRSFYRDFMSERAHMDVGHFGLGDESSLVFYSSALVRRLLGWILTLSGLGGLVLFVFVGKRSPAIVLAAFLLPYLAVISLWSMHADRYLVPVLPPLLVLAAAFADRLAGAAGRRLGLVRLRPAALALLVVAIAVPAVQAHHDRIRKHRDDPRLTAKNWIEANIPAGAWIVTERYGPELFPASKFLQVQPEARQPLMDALSGRPVYSVQTLQMHQTDPGMSAPFYDLSLYDDADFVITSSAVRSRYERDPERFSRHIRFYRRLEGTFDRVKVFRGPDGSGPVLTLYHNAPRRIPFGNRRTVSGPPRLDLGPGSGRERLSEFYYRMGLNYEVFSFTEEAMQSYDLALEYPAPPAMTAMLIFRKTGCLSRLGRGHEIPAFLQQLIATTRNESVRSFCRRLLVQSR